MAVGRDGRPDPLLHAKVGGRRAATPRKEPLRPREAAALATVAASLQGKPPAGSAAAFVAERRRSSPARNLAPSPAPCPEAARTHPRASSVAPHTPRVPVAPPRQPGAPRRPASPAARLSVASGGTQKRCASPRVPAHIAPARVPENVEPQAPAKNVSTHVAVVSQPMIHERKEEASPSHLPSWDDRPAATAKNVSTHVAVVSQPMIHERQEEVSPSHLPSWDDRPAATPTNSMQEKQGVGPPAMPSRDDRPVATPTNSTRPCHINVCSAVPDRSCLFAEAWLRLARIAMLELPKRCPPHRLLFQPPANIVPSEQECTDQESTAPQHLGENNKWSDMAFPKDDGPATTMMTSVLDEDDGDNDDPMSTQSAQRAMAGWSRILTRVMSITGAEPPEGPDATQALSPPVGLVANLREGQGHAHICLGDIMEESISWMEVDSEDDCHTPKAADMMPPMEQEEEEEEVVPSHLKNIYRQQNAPGIVAGMNKCLSF